MSRDRYHWATPGDVNAFFGLMLDNIADLLLAVGLLTAVFGFPTNVALRYMVPGTAIGVFVGDMLFFWMALRLARQTGRGDITAMPLGLDTPSTFGMVFFVLGPAFLAKKQALGVVDGAGQNDALVFEAAIYAWQIGICSIFISGLFKLLCALGSNWVRRVVPRAGLLGSLAGIALVLISFLPFTEVLHFPVVGLVALAVILMTLVARIPTPGRVPGALAALLVSGSLYYIMVGAGLLEHEHDWRQLDTAKAALFPYEWTSVFRFEWTQVLSDSMMYLPVVIPFALATVVGGIDCTESAAASGDEFDTGQVIAVEAVATVVASVCGGVIQTTPYIGHPAYKAMGGRAAYTLATAIFIGTAGLLGYFGFLYVIIPKATVFPILIFVGLEITSQSFHATPKRHYAAVVIACVPALASLVLIFIDKFLGEMAAHGISLEQISGGLQAEIATIRVLGNGFIVTSLLWASALAAMIDRKLRVAAVCMAVAAGLSLFGIMHSPFPGAAMFLVWNLDAASRQTPFSYTAGYLLIALMMISWDAWLRSTGYEFPLQESEH
ncbi:MAG: permease [Pirellulaceae bacterium]|nr:permease [Pirellulaceae bacterium]